jgi:hypothetical protein
MLGFNFLSMENYATVEGFASKKEKFTVDEIDNIMDVDNDTSTTMLYKEGDVKPSDIMVDDEDDMETTTTMVDDEDDMETTTTMVNDEDNMETKPTMVDDEDDDENDMETTTTMVDDDDDDNSKDNKSKNDSGNEGFVGSSIIRRQVTRSTLYLILCIGIVYIAIKVMCLYQKKRMNMVYKRVKFLKLNKLNLDTDLVLSVVIGGLIYLIGMRMGWF